MCKKREAVPLKQRSAWGYDILPLDSLTCIMRQAHGTGRSYGSKGPGYLLSLTICENRFLVVMTELSTPSLGHPFWHSLSTHLYITKAITQKFGTV